MADEYSLLPIFKTVARRRARGHGDAGEQVKSYRVLSVRTTPVFSDLLGGHDRLIKVISTLLSSTSLCRGQLGSTMAWLHAGSQRSVPMYSRHLTVIHARPEEVEQVGWAVVCDRNPPRRMLGALVALYLLDLSRLSYPA